MQEQLSNIPKCDIQFVLSDQLFLDVLLTKIRSKTISYATMKQNHVWVKKRGKDLGNSIQSLEAKIVLSENERSRIGRS